PSRGVCWRKAKVCDLCETDEECGDNGLCMAYNYDGETRNVCLRKATAGACPFGMILYDGNDADLRGMCVPQYADCGNFRPCTSDEDCDQLNPVCDARRGICVRGCSFDYVENKSLNCPPDRVCHMTEWGTNPQLLGDCATGHLWGYGSCGSPCQTHDDCSSYGEGFVCETYGNEARCAPAAAATPSRATSVPTSPAVRPARPMTTARATARASPARPTATRRAACPPPRPASWIPRIRRASGSAA